MNEDDLRELLQGDRVAPPSRVDLGRVMRDGRRHRWQRGGIVVAVVLALALLAPNPPASQGPAAAGPGGFDPVLVLRIVPGWLPAGVHEGPTRRLWTTMQSVTYTDGRGTDFTVTLYAPGSQQIKTRPGYRWQWSRGAWATIDGVAPGSADDLWRRIAEHLRTDGQRPVPVGLKVVTTTEVTLVGVDIGADGTTLVLAARAGPGYRVTLHADGTIDRGGLEGEVAAVPWTLSPIG